MLKKCFVGFVSFFYSHDFVRFILQHSYLRDLLKMRTSKNIPHGSQKLSQTKSSKHLETQQFSLLFNCIPILVRNRLKTNNSRIILRLSSHGTTLVIQTVVSRYVGLCGAHFLGTYNFPICFRIIVQVK